MRSVVKWLWLPVLIAFGWSAWVLWSRHAENAEIERRAEQKSAAETRKVLQAVGGEDLKVLMFYANPPVVQRGERGLLCYGVSINAKEVHIDPPVDGVRPSISRCVEVRPGKDTSYTLTTKDGQGKEASQTVSVRVR